MYIVCKKGSNCFIDYYFFVKCNILSKRLTKFFQKCMTSFRIFSLYLKNFFIILIIRQIINFFLEKFNFSAFLTHLFLAIYSLFSIFLEQFSIFFLQLITAIYSFSSLFVHFFFFVTYK